MHTDCKCIATQLQCDIFYFFCRITVKFSLQQPGQKKNNLERQTNSCLFRNGSSDIPMNMTFLPMGTSYINSRMFYESKYIFDVKQSETVFNCVLPSFS